MPKLTKKASKKKKRARASSEMRKFYHGKLHSGSKTGPTVTDPEQAKAISMSESGQSRKVGKKKGKGKGKGKKKGKGKGRKVGRKR
jgi:hypothetical protein